MQRIEKIVAYDETEKFCKDKAVYNAIIRSIEIIDGKSKNETKMPFQIFCLTLWLCPLMNKLDTTIY